MRQRISQYRRQPIQPGEDPQIGGILLEEPFFFERDDWIPSPPDFKGLTQMGKSYDMQSGSGEMLCREVTARLERAKVKTIGSATEAYARSGPACWQTESNLFSLRKEPAL